MQVPRGRAQCVGCPCVFGFLTGVMQVPGRIVERVEVAFVLGCFGRIFCMLHALLDDSIRGCQKCGYGGIGFLDGCNQCRLRIVGTDRGRLGFSQFRFGVVKGCLCLSNRGGVGCILFGQMQVPGGRAEACRWLPCFRLLDSRHTDTRPHREAIASCLYAELLP